MHEQSPRRPDARRRVVGKLHLVLIAAVAAQLGIVAYRWPGDPPPASATRSLAVGDTVPLITGATTHGEVDVSLVHSSGRWTAVLAFDSKCVHCDTAAPHWREWLARAHAFATIALTRDSLPRAEEYRAERGWDVQILAVPGVARGTNEWSLLNRTPWAFLFDEQGVLRYQGSGHDLALLDSVASSLNGVGPNESGR